MPIETLIRALTGQTARPYYMPPGLLGIGGNVPEGAHVSDAGEVINPETWQPYPEVRRPGGAFPLTRGPDGEPIAAMPKGLDALMTALVGRGNVVPRGAAAQASSQVVEAPAGAVKLVPNRLSLGPDMHGFKIYRGDRQVGWADTSRMGPGEIKVDYMGAGKPGEFTSHFENSLGHSATRDVFRQMKEYYGGMHPGEKFEIIGGHRVGGARGRTGPRDIKVPFNPAVAIPGGAAVLEALTGGANRDRGL